MVSVCVCEYSREAGQIRVWSRDTQYRCTAYMYEPSLLDDLRKGPTHFVGLSFMWV